MDQPQLEGNAPVASLDKANTLSRLVKIGLILLTSALIIGATGYGVYSWQQRVAAKKELALQNEINKLRSVKPTEIKQPSAVNDENAQTIYTSKVGGLTLKLPSQYAVIVNVDGNKGGAPGSTLRIGTNESKGVVRDNDYEWAEIQIGHLSPTADQQAKIISAQLTEDGFEDIKVVDSTFNNLPAKLITANGFSYDAQRRIYSIKSGEFIYQFTSKTRDASKDDDLLKAVIAGSTLVEKKLN